MVLQKTTFACLLISLMALSFASARAASDSSFSGVQNLVKTSMGLVEPAFEDLNDVYDDIDTYITMFLKGAGVTQRVMNTTDCLGSARDLARGLDQSITNMITNGFNLDNYLAATQAIGEAQPMIKVCFNASHDGFQQAADHFGQFSSTRSFFEKMGLRVLYGFFDWYRLYFSLDHAVSNVNMTEISFYSGQLVHALLDFNADINGTLTLQNTPVSNSVVTFLFDFVYNFLDGSMILQSKQVESCQANIVGFGHNIEYAREQFSTHTDEGLFNGVYAIADLFGIFNNANIVCISGVTNAWTRIVDYFVTPSNLMRTLLNMLWNTISIIRHTFLAVKCSFVLDAKCMGSNLGSLLYVVFAKYR